MSTDVTNEDLQRMATRVNNIGDDARVRLKEYVDVRLTDLERSIDETRDAMEYRLEGLDKSKDEYLVSLREMTKDLATKSEVMGEASKRESDVHTINSSIRSLELTRSEMAGKASKMSANIALSVGVMGLLMSLTSLIIVILRGG